MLKNPGKTAEKALKGIIDDGLLDKIDDEKKDHTRDRLPGYKPGLEGKSNWPRHIRLWK